MNEIESFKAMLDRAGVVHKIGARRVPRVADPQNRIGDWDWVDDSNTVVIEAKAGEKNNGYNGFVAQFVFNEDGSLESVGVWE